MAETISVRIRIDDLESFKEVGIAANDLGTTTRTRHLASLRDDHPDQTPSQLPGPDLEPATRTCHLASLRDGHPGQTQEATRTRPRTSHSDPPPGHPDGYFSKCW